MCHGGGPVRAGARCAWRTAGAAGQRGCCALLWRGSRLGGPPCGCQCRARRDKTAQARRPTSQRRAVLCGARASNRCPAPAPCPKTRGGGEATCAHPRRGTNSGHDSPLYPHGIHVERRRAGPEARPAGGDRGAGCRVRAHYLPGPPDFFGCRVRARSVISTSTDSMPGRSSPSPPRLTATICGRSKSSVHSGHAYTRTRRPSGDLGRDKCG